MGSPFTKNSPIDLRSTTRSSSLPAPIAFLLEDLARDLVANDLAGIIADLDPVSFAPRVLSLSGDERSLPADIRARLPESIVLKGPLRRPFWNVGLIRRFLLDVKETKPAVIVVSGGREALEFAAKVVEWAQRPAVYLAPSGDPAFPWGRRRALDAFAKIVATTGRLTYRLVEEFKLPEQKVATIYPGVDAERFAFAPMPGTRAAEGGGAAKNADERAPCGGRAEGDESPLVGVLGDPPSATMRAIAAAFAEAGEVPGASEAAGASERASTRRPRLAAPKALAPLADLGPSWTAEAFARVSLLLFLPDSDWETGFETMLRGMAVGRPVIAAVPSERIDDMVIDGETGRIVANAEPDAIASAVRELLASRELHASMGIAARMRIAGEFGRARRRLDWDALLRVVGRIPFPSPTVKGPLGPGPAGPTTLPIKFNAGNR